MRKRRVLGLCLALCAVAGAHAADAPPQLHVQMFGRGGLTLEFDRPMLTWNGDAGDVRIASTPPLPCSWSWVNDTELTCHVTNASDPRPATHYRIVYGGGLWSQDGVELPAQTLDADSDRPEITYAQVARWQHGWPTIELRSNLPLTADGLRAVLDLRLDGALLAYELARQPQTDLPSGAPADSSDHWQLQPTPAAQGGTLALRLQAGLHTPLGELPGERELNLLRARVAEPLRVRQLTCLRPYAPPKPAPKRAPDDDASEIDCSAGHDVEFEFSAPLTPAAIDAFRAALPPGLSLHNTTAGNNWPRPPETDVWLQPGSILHVSLEQPQRTFTWTLPAALVGVDGSTPQHALPVTLHAGDFGPGVSVAAPRVLARTGMRLPPLLQAINTPQLEIETHELGTGDKFQDAHAASGTRRRNVSEKLDVPSPRRELRADGGLLAGAVALATPQGPQPMGSYAVDYAAFNLSASVAGRQWLVWMTEWNGAGAIGGADVELLGIDPKGEINVLATATTAADGVALIQRPADTGDDDKPRNLLLRATYQGHRAILPLHRTLDEHRPSWAHNGSVDDGKAGAWGISDRPLYRPGETVHYRIWLRQRDANRLRAAAQRQATLHLASLVGEKNLGDIDVKLDAFGGASGDLRLPDTLHDDNYCLGLDPNYEAHGVCFRVTGYHANDMWAELRADRTFAHAGDAVEFDAAAGYFSGGPAAETEAALRGVLRAKAFTAAYPQFAGFEFAQADPYQAELNENFELPTALRTDAQGHMRRRIALVGDGAHGDTPPAIAFGEALFDVSVAGSGANSASSAPLTLLYSRYARYVGLKVEPWLLRADQDPTVSVTVASERGETVANVSVEVTIETAPETKPGQPTPPGEVLARCTLRAGQSAPCPFRAREPGRYRLRAAAADAAPVTIERYVASGAVASTQVAAKVPHTELVLGRDKVAAGAAIELVLQQPYAHAAVLFCVEHGRVLKHWIEHVDAPVTKFTLPADAAWAPGVTLHATVIDAADPFAHDAPLWDTTEAASVDLLVAAPAQAPPLTLVPERSAARPGEEIAFTLHNASAQPREITFAVVDDAVRALAPEIVANHDPASEAWLGQLASWRTPDWFGLGEWPRLRDAGVANAKTGDYSIALLGLPGQALDTIVVTGSNIRRVDIITRGPATARAAPFLPAGARGAAANVRAVFGETAWWESGATLDPGAQRTVRVRLPDNLTRWRALAWSNDADDGFALAQATVEAALPIEVRTELPTRLFPGDTAQLGASVRNHGAAPRRLALRFDAHGAGVAAHAAASATIAANAQQPLALTALPNALGTIAIEARASDAHDADAIAGSVEVASPVRRERVPVAGWLPRAGVNLKLPALPAGATAAALDIHVARGLDAFAQGWADALRDYPHRCWEQILSRALGAAAAKQLGLAAAWPDADIAIDDALRLAGQFQDSTGTFHFFVPDAWGRYGSGNLWLTAYTVRGFAFLRTLGYPVPNGIEARAQQVVQRELETPIASREWHSEAAEEFAAMAGVADAESTLDANRLEDVWNGRENLSVGGRADLARALAARPAQAERARVLVDELRRAGTQHGLARRLEDDMTWLFASNAADQCALIETLARVDHAPDAAELRLQWLRGLGDLYGGGAAALGTQASARCLMALAGLAASGDQRAVKLTLSGAANGSVALAAAQRSGDWRGAFPGGGAALAIKPDASDDTLLSYVANAAFDVDARHGEKAAVGFALERRYAVLRAKAWQPLPQNAIREGDWVRVTLILRTRAPRRFVAVSDSVAGGLRPTDLELAGVSDLETRRLAGLGNAYFPEHRIDDRAARFYAESLPPGTHEIHYYARATHAGRYAALPAVAELMYGSASVARTAAASVQIEARAAAPAKPAPPTAAK